MPEPSEVGRLVGAYSLELETTLPPGLPSHDVRRVFVENERRTRNQEIENATWRKHYEPWKPVEGKT